MLTGLQAGFNIQDGLAEDHKLMTFGYVPHHVFLPHFNISIFKFA